MIRFDSEVKLCHIVLIVGFTLPKHFLFLHSQYEKKTANIHAGQNRKVVIRLNGNSANMKIMKSENRLITTQNATANYISANGGRFGDNLPSRACPKIALRRLKQSIGV